MAAQVIVTVDNTGKANVETVGVQGPACEKLSAAIEAALGTGGVNTRKPEFHQQPNLVQPQAATKGA